MRCMERLRCRHSSFSFDPWPPPATGFHWTQATQFDSENFLSDHGGGLGTEHRTRQWQHSNRRAKRILDERDSIFVFDSGAAEEHGSATIMTTTMMVPEIFYFLHKSLLSDVMWLIQRTRNSASVEPWANEGSVDPEPLIHLCPPGIAGIGNLAKSMLSPESEVDSYQVAV